MIINAAEKLTYRRSF